MDANTLPPVPPPPVLPPTPVPPPAMLRQPPAPRPGRRAAVIVAVVTASVAALAAAAWFAMPFIRERLAPLPPTDAVNGSVSDAPDPVAVRDQERYRHVNEIRIALTSHVNEFKAYPTTLAELVPRHLPEELKDPSTGASYAYSKDDAGFVLTFSLEGGIFSLSPGEHIMTARGIDIRAETPFVAEPEGNQNVQALPPEPGSVIPTAPEDETAPMDSDGDGHSDAEEAALGTDPLKHDTDDDGLSDSEETGKYGTDPKNADTDGDGFTDGAEVRAGYDPNGPGKLQ